jgi:hypothetical protein
MLRRNFIFSCCCVLLMSLTASQAQTPSATRRTLLKTVVAHLEKDVYGKHKHFADFCGKNSPWEAGIVDAREPWAFVDVGRRQDKRGEKAPDYLLPDGAFFLLKKQKGVWRVIEMGTDSYGVGAKRGVPKRYWKKWGID